MKEADPAWAARIHPHDTFRARRGLGVFLTTGRGLSGIFAQASGVPFWDMLNLIIEVPREVLYQRIAERTDKMLENGWLEEVNSLKKMGYNRTVKPMRSIGYREVFALSEGEMDITEAKASIVKGTKALARRQLTWSRKVKGSVSILLVGNETADQIADIILRRDEVKNFLTHHNIWRETAR